MEEHTHHSTHHAQDKSGLKIKKDNLMKSIVAILSIALMISIIFNVRGESEGGALSKDAAAEKALTYINANVLASQGTTATLKEVEEKNNMYNLKLEINGQEFESYITKDAALLFPTSIDLSMDIEAPDDAPASQTPPADIERSDKPEVELFIMSHCPYGTQAEKGIIPAVKALGDKIDFKLRFVNYAMHPTQGEVEEQLNQYCIREEQESKLLDYLECFLEDGDGEACLAKIKVDKARLEECVEKADEEFKILDNLEDKEKWLNGRFPKFLIDDELNQKYGIRGSPALIINGVNSGAGRAPASYLKGICESFNEAPEECEQELSSVAPSPGFGYTATGTAADSAAQCS